MIGKLLAFWILWFFITILIGRVFPDSVNNIDKKRKIPISMGNGIIGFFITVFIIVALKALIL